MAGADAGRALRQERPRPNGYEQHATLSRRINGHFNYFGVNWNQRSMRALVRVVERVWFQALRRRSQRARRMTWKRFGSLLKAFPLPAVRVRVRVWAPTP